MFKYDTAGLIQLKQSESSYQLSTHMGTIY